MAYKFQEGAANYDGEVSGSSFRTAGSLSGSGDLAVTGNMHAAQYYGGGGNLTGISADTVDVTEKDDNVAYQLVGVAAAGTDVTLVADDDAASKFTFNPSSGLLSGSKAQFTGASVFGAALNVTGATTLAGTLSSSAGGQFVGNSFFGGAVNISGTLTVGSGSVLLSGSGISGSGNTQMVSGNYSGALLVSGGLTVGTGSVTINALGGNQLSSSAGAVFVSSISSSGDLAVTGNVHAAQFYGGGAGITGITSDAVDVTASLGASLVYGIVGTQAAQSDGTLGLITTVSGAYFNPLDATEGSLLSLSGNVSGLQASTILLGPVDGTKARTIKSETMFGTEFLYLGAEGGAQEIYISGSDVRLAGDELSMTAGALSSSATLQFVGATVLGNTLHVSGASTLAGKLSSSAAMEIVGQVDVVGSLNVTGSSNLNGGIDVNGSNFTAGTDGAVTMTSLSVQTGDIGTFANISGSGTAQFGGATILGSTLGLSGAADFESTLEVQSGVYNHGYQRYEMSTITSNTELTASSSKSYQMVSGGTSALTVILPSASAGQYYQYGIKRHSLMSGNVIIEGGGSELIDGATNVTLSSVNASVYLISDGTQWNIF